MQDGKRVDIPIGEGEIFLLPPNMPHSPRRPANTVGLVIERMRRAGERDGFQWYCENCHHKLYEEFVEITNIETQLPPVFDRFFGNARQSHLPQLRHSDGRRHEMIAEAHLRRAKDARRARSRREPRHRRRIRRPGSAAFRRGRANIEAASSSGSFSGSVATGASANCSTLTLTPHCQMTHTESVAHLTRESGDAWRVVPRGLLPAVVVSVVPEPARESNESTDPQPFGTDTLISKRRLRAAWPMARMVDPVAADHPDTAQRPRQAHAQLHRRWCRRTSPARRSNG